MKIRQLLAAVLIACLPPVALPAQVRVGQRYVEPDVCEGECCQFGPLVTVKSAPVYGREGDTTTVAFWTTPGDTLENSTGNLHYARVGAVLVLRALTYTDLETESSGTLAAGDTVPLLSYRGEGVYYIWHAGKKRLVGTFWNDPNDSQRTPDAPGKVLDYGQQTWWLRVGDRRGRHGWLIWGDGMKIVDPACS